MIESGINILNPGAFFRNNRVYYKKDEEFLIFFHLRMKPGNIRVLHYSCWLEEILSPFSRSRMVPKIVCLEAFSLMRTCIVLKYFPTFSGNKKLSFPINYLT